MRSLPRRLVEDPAAPLPWARCASLRWLAAVAMALSVGACGGGGGGDAAPPSDTPAPPAPAPAAAPITAQLTVPTPVGYDADRRAAFDRLNAIRLSAGLGMLAQSVALDQAAQAHAMWIVANDSFTHDEVAGTPGFTGVSWTRRDEAFGYVPLSGYEVMASGGHGDAEVDTLVNGVYHRAALLAFEPVDVGIGWSGAAAADVAMPLVIDVTRPGTDTTRGLGQAAQAGIGNVAIWPLDGAAGVPWRLGAESPNPVPGQDVLSLGTPVSLTVPAAMALRATVFVVREATTDAVVPTQLLTSQNDPNGALPASFIAAVPLAALQPATTYRVSFTGSATASTAAAPVAIARTWSFTTAAR